MKKYLSLLAFCALATASAQPPAPQTRWTIANDHAIRWTVDGSRLPHNDHVEMSGEQISARLHYGVESDGRFTLTRTLVWPMLRMLPNDTFGGLTRDFPQNFLDAVRIDGKALAAEQVEYLRLDGLLTVVSRYGDIEVTRCLFPSPARAAFCEQYTLRNAGPITVAVELNPVRDEIRTDADAGVEGSYTLIAATDFVRSRTLRLAPGETCIFGASVRGLKTPEVELPLDISAERAQREAFVAEVCGNLSLESPEPVLNTMFALAKVRAAESVFRTRGGLLHAPGGVYYAAIWCNDQPEYVNPFFPQLGYAKGNEAALNSFLHFARYMNPEYRYIPWSVIAEGYDTYGPFDRGDAAMLAYGAGRYALQMGANSTNTASSLPRPTNWKNGSRPAMPISAPRRSTTTPCAPRHGSPSRPDGRNGWPTNTAAGPKRCVKTSNASSVQRSKGTPPTAITRATTSCVRGSAFRWSRIFSNAGRRPWRPCSPRGSGPKTEC